MRPAQGLAETELGINTTIMKLGLQVFILEDICSSSGLIWSRKTWDKDPTCCG